MRVTAEIDRREAVAALNKVGGINGRLVPALASALNRWLGETVSHIRENKLTGQVLRVQTGALRWSVIHTPVRNSGGLLSASLQAGTAGRALVYARIHELGGTIQHPGGTAYIFNPKTGNAIFISNRTAGSGWPETLRTRPHPIRIPARPYMRPGTEEMRPRLVQLLEQQIEEYARD